jgi:hypothetical protein
MMTVLKMEVADSSEVLVHLCQTPQRCIPKNQQTSICVKKMSLWKMVSVGKKLSLCNKCKGKKCKVTPLQAWTDPKRSRGFRLPDFKTIGT